MNLQEYHKEYQQLKALGQHPLNQAALEQVKRLPGPYRREVPVEQLIDLMVGSLRLNRELQDELAGRLQGSKQHRERLELISLYVSPEELRAAETVEEAGELIVEALQLEMDVRRN